MLNEKLQDIRTELQGKWGILAVLLLGWLFCFKYIVGGSMPMGLMIGFLPLVLLVGGLFINKPIVLFAVHKSITLTNAAIPNSAPFLLFILLVIKYNT